MMELDEFLTEWHSSSPFLTVHTSGSTGQPKPIVVEKRRMEASARLTCCFLRLQPADTALLCLPLNYIAGKMMVVRTVVGQLRLVAVPPDGHPMYHISEIPDFAAMVPMQVYNSLHVSEECEKLKKIRHLIIGGGAVDEDMRSALRGFPHCVWSTYGMTETLSHIALCPLTEAAERHAGYAIGNSPGCAKDCWYAPFPSVSLSLSQEGCLIIHAPEVCGQPLQTNDRAEIDPQTGYFRILGRKDNVICSGGIKIQIEEVERLLRRTLSVPFMITKRPHPKFGEEVVLLIDTPIPLPRLEENFKILPRYWRPHAIVTVPRLPLTETGKPARALAEQWAATGESVCK